MLSQKHAIDFPCEEIALELGLALSLVLLVRTMPARPALRFLLTTYPRLLYERVLTGANASGEGLNKGFIYEPNKKREGCKRLRASDNERQFKTSETYASIGLISSIFSPII